MLHMNRFISSTGMTVVVRIVWYASHALLQLGMFKSNHPHALCAQASAWQWTEAWAVLSRNEVAVGAFFPPGPGGTESVRTESMYARGIPMAERAGY